MRDDTPDDLVHDAFAGALFPGHPLGREIAGHAATPSSAMSRDAIADYHRGALPSRRTWWSRSAGNLDHDAVVEMVERALPGPTVTAARPPGPTASEPRRPETGRGRRATARAGAPRARHPGAAAVTIPTASRSPSLDQVLGGGMSSRLFQEVRERRGLAYSVFSYRSAYEETGAFARVLRHRARARRRRARRRLRASSTAWSPTAASPSASSSAPRATWRGRSRCRSRARRAACTASGAPSSRSARSPTSTRSSREVDVGHDDDVARVVDRVLRTGRRTLAAVGPITESTCCRPR